MPNPYLVGVTGTIGSGKSLVGKLISEAGHLVIDTDNVVHDLFASDARLRRAIDQRFGASVISPAGTVDRVKLGEIVFADSDARRDLEAIVHPAVINACHEIVEQNKDERVIFFLVPLLFEARLEEHYDAVWAVIAQESILLERLKIRTGLDEQDLRKRLGAQMQQDEKAKRADSVIDNSGAIEQTKAQVNTLLNALPI